MRRHEAELALRMTLASTAAAVQRNAEVRVQLRAAVATVQHDRVGRQLRTPRRPDDVEALRDTAERLARLLEELTGGHAAAEPVPAAPQPGVVLTRRQLEVLGLLGEGL